jgi:membrane fusion protein, multidrug efflux system
MSDTRREELGRAAGAAERHMAERNLRSVPPRNDAPRPQPNLPVVNSPGAPLEDKAPEKKKRWPRRKLIRWGLFSLLPIVLIAGGVWYVTGGQVMTTDDAYVNANRVGVSTDISGTVQTVEVTNNERVTKGQILFRLDPLQFQIAVDNAKANLEQVALNLDAMKQDYTRMLRDTQAQQAQVQLDQINFDRAKFLLNTGTAAQANYDQATYTLQADQAKLLSLQQQANVQLARLHGNAETPTDQLPEYLQAQAQLAEAQRELKHTFVKAAFSGVVTEVPTTSPGRYLGASNSAFYLVDDQHVWVDAQPKETEITYVRPGQPVTVTIDTYPNETWRGTVESISPAASQEFSLLPAQNTSGNWVKVVQRVPMRIRLGPPDKNRPPLRAGMSAEVSVNTGHARGLPHFLTSIL